MHAPYVRDTPDRPGSLVPDGLIDRSKRAPHAGHAHVHVRSLYVPLMGRAPRDMSRHASTRTTTTPEMKKERTIMYRVHVRPAGPAGWVM
jgi:hypothetical protein